MNLRRRSNRVEHIDPPPAFDPVRGRPFGQPAPEQDDRAAAELAAGQLALANAVRPDPINVGFDPRRSAWAGTRD